MSDNNAENPGLPAIQADRGRPGILQVSILYSVTILLFLFIGYRVQHNDLYSGLLITEFGLVMLPAFLFLLFFRFNIKDVVRLNGTRPVNFILAFGIMLFALPLASVFNLLNLFFVNSIFGKIIVQPLPIPSNGLELLLSILVVAGSAGICEEFLFRGVIQRGLERAGEVRAILITALLFSLMHMDFQKIFGTFFLGALIGFVVYRANSIFCGMFAHFMNNALAVLASYASAKLMELLGKAGSSVTGEMDLNSLFSTFEALPKSQLIFVLFFYGFILLFVAVIFVLLLFALIKVNPVRRDLFDEREHRVRDRRMEGLFGLVPGLIAIAVIYFVEVRGFIGAGNWFTNIVKLLLGV
ncbi:MAG TPA: type II CAAX endopeptidase family protein [Clostridia bacterium]|nr:type II CAAX endopeptidase family protein [Clostridia bacterium]